MRQRSRLRFGGWTALLLVLALVIASCTGNGDTATTVGGDTGTTVEGDGDGTTDTTAGGDGEVRNPGEFIITKNTDIVTADPVGIPGYLGWDEFYEPLLDYALGDELLEPVLATEIPSDENGLISEDGLTYTFPLREGVLFHHDGSEMTAEDVKFSWDRAITMNLPEGEAFRLVDIVAETRVVDDYTFEVTLKEPAAYFLNAVVPSGAAMIVSQDAVEANGGVVAGERNEWMHTNTAGTGPYRLAEWQPNEFYFMEAFEDHWRGDPGEDVRRVIVDGHETAVIGLREGSFDWIEAIPTLKDQLEGDPNVCIYEEGQLVEPILAPYNTNIDTSLLPAGDTIPADFFHDPRVRQAFSYTFDYETYVSNVLGGIGEQASWIPPAIFGYNPDVPIYTQNLERAEELFREAGWWDEGFTLSIAVESEAEEFYSVGLLLKDNMAQLNPNFQIELIGLSGAAFDEAFVQRPYPYAMWIKNQDSFKDPHPIFVDHWHPDGLWGETFDYRNNGYETPEAADEMAALIEEAGVTSNVDARYDMYTEIQERAFENALWLWVANEGHIQFHRCWIDGYVQSPLWNVPRPSYWDK